MAEEYDYLYKIVLIGDPSVGKSNICLRYMSDDFKKETRATIGVEFQSKHIKTEDNKTIRAQIWDTAGEEKYKSVTSAYFRGAVGALLIYDITCKKSFENVSDWLNRLMESTSADLIVMLVGNKSDLKEKREVSTAEGTDFAMKNGLAFIETSALQGTNVELSFSTIIFRK